MRSAYKLCSLFTCPRTPWLLVLLSASVAVAAYLQALHYPFISDDITYIPENTRLLNLKFSELWRLFADPYNCCNEFLPLRDISYWLDVAIFGQNPSASRSVNIALYLLSLPLIPTGKYRDAINTADNIAIPEFRDAMIMLIKSDYAVKFNAISTGNPDEAIALLKKTELLLKQPPAQIKWNAPARYTWDAYKDDLLMSQWDSLVERFPDDMLVRYYTGLWNVEIHRYLISIAYLRAATESQRLPESIRGTAYKTLGLALMNSGYVARAEAPLRAALNQSPPDLQAYCILSSVYKQTKKFDEAEHADEECHKQAFIEGFAR